MIARRARSLAVCSDSVAMCMGLAERRLLGLFPLREISWHNATVALCVNSFHSGRGAPVHRPFDDEPHVDDDLKRIHKGKPLAPILLIRGDMTRGLPLIVADGYHRICAICYFDESAPIPCRTAISGA